MIKDQVQAIRKTHPEWSWFIFDDLSEKDDILVSPLTTVTETTFAEKVCSLVASTRQLLSDNRQRLS